ncbi:dephospho-CoA kinase [Tessaracoccus oleiagri]|uniref:Dephospho-CoA kinase n=1 Tax=Tessaracoccus oleiagri TaxID=686624 RepID=A0A1G9LJZ1_9ACTN|nr:dephospho-CoA kinase [Tessaracoccus oleiagri]SDL62271.1 dephospho-CoA kinase [Tessaracoccus oleiagri]
MPRIALTGGIASGKSTVARMLEARGVVIVDSDVLAREVVEPGTEGLDAIVERFGSSVLQPDGSLDRARLGSLVFADPAARADLNAIVHPLVRRRAEELEAAAPAGALVVQVIPLLVEAGLVGGFDHVIVVDVAVDEQLRRLMSRNGYSCDEAMARIRAQATREERLRVADTVIDSSGSLAETEAQVQAALDRIVASTDQGS